MQHRLLRTLFLAALFTVPAFAGGDDILDGMFIFGPEGSGVQIYLVEGEKEARTVRAVNTAVLKTAFPGMTHVVEVPNDPTLREQITVGATEPFQGEGARRAVVDFQDNGVAFNNFNEPQPGQLPTQAGGAPAMQEEDDGIAPAGGCCARAKVWVHSWGSK